MLGVEFIGASKKPQDIRVEVGDGEGEAMAHLCLDNPNCGRLAEAPNTLHVCVNGTLARPARWISLGSQPA